MTKWQDTGIYWIVYSKFLFTYFLHYRNNDLIDLHWQRDKKTKEALVTGGAGFIGSNIVDRLIKDGHDVIILDNLSTGRKENINPKAKFYNLDITDSKIEEIFAENKIDVVFHLAAQIDVRKSVSNPIFDATTNIIGTINLLNMIQK